MNRRRWIYIALVATVFLVAFIPRAIYPVSRPPQWYTRSVQFIYDVGRGAFGETVYSEHPGVTTMWLSGIALRIAGVTPEQRPGGAYVDPESLTARESAIGVLPLAFVIAALIGMMYGFLVRLFGPLAAFSAALLVALDPFFLSNSKVLHVDGLLAAFVVASALSLLLFIRRRRTRWVILSGVLGGLALLTKSPALFLLPYVALCLGLGVLFDSQMGWRRAVQAGLAWLGIACFVYFALYPAMWVDPIGTLRTVYSRAALRVSWPHPSPLFFLGQPVAGDPGPTYYLVTWGCKLTAIVSVLTLVALLYAALDRHRPRGERASVGLLLAFAVFFTLQMTIGAKKMPRYLLPAFPAVDILAGVGLAWLVGRALSRVAWPRAAPAVVIAAALLLQGALILPRHPYYDTHFSELVGARTGIRALSTQWQGEGQDIAARTLNGLPRADQRVAGSHMPTLFRQYFDGQTVEVSDAAAWYAFGINNTMRNEGTEDGVPWDFYRRRAPLSTVRFGRVPYSWVYPIASGPQHPAAFSFDPGIQLVGYDIAPPPYQPGQPLRLQLYWQALESIEEDYTVFVHLLDGAGQLVAQQDNFPGRGTRPTSSWGPGTTVIDPYDLSLPDELTPGDLTVTLGLYRWPESTRLPAYSAEGERLPDDRVVLAVVPVTPPAPEPWVWVARLLAAAVLIGALVMRRNRDG